jgi:hypothetical protein
MPRDCSCPIPNDDELPPGWHWCTFERRIVTNTGIQVPLADSPLIGSPEEQAALRELQAWRRP